MKKLITLAVGLMFVFGTTAVFSQEKGGDTKKADKKAARKTPQKADKQQPGDDRPAKQKTGGK
jgi:hypothetical protein